MTRSLTTLGMSQTPQEAANDVERPRDGRPTADPAAADAAEILAADEAWLRELAER